MISETRVSAWELVRDIALSFCVTQAGGDATEAFEDLGHGAEAREILASHKIGYVPDYTPEKYKAAAVRFKSGKKKRKARSNVIASIGPSSWMY